ncbi:MAG: hypothetical protein JWM85_218 [Acidimicrobiaceae bacterium]|nr:hypothetical protein [Acidimicrobiaceae bacterium]
MSSLFHRGRVASTPFTPAMARRSLDGRSPPQDRPSAPRRLARSTAPGNRGLWTPRGSAMAPLNRAVFRAMPLASLPGPARVASCGRTRSSAPPTWRRRSSSRSVPMPGTTSSSARPTASIQSPAPPGPSFTARTAPTPMRRSIRVAVSTTPLPWQSWPARADRRAGMPLRRAAVPRASTPQVNCSRTRCQLTRPWCRLGRCFVQTLVTLASVRGAIG